MLSAIPSPSPVGKPLRRRLWFVRGVLGVILVLLGWGAWILTTAGRHDGHPPVDGQSAGPPDSATAASDRELARRVLGQWHDKYMGTRRTMTLREDGRGEMLVEVSGWGAVVFAPRLRFDMEWSVRDGRLVQRSLGGEPEGAVRALLALKGNQVDEPILELTADRLLLLQADGETRLDWRRTPQP